MLISLKEYKLLTLGKVTFNPGKFKIIVSKNKIKHLKAVAILHESGYFSKLWLNTEFSKTKSDNINIAYAKLKGLSFDTTSNKARAAAKLQSTANLLYNASGVVVLSPTELCCIFNNNQISELDYLLSTQNNIDYKFALNVSRNQGFKALQNLKEQINTLDNGKNISEEKKPETPQSNATTKACTCGKNCNHTCKKSNIYLNPEIAEYVNPNHYVKEEE